MKTLTVNYCYGQRYSKLANGKPETRPQRKDYNQLASNEKLDNRQIEDIHIDEADGDSDASSTDLDERDTRGVCPPCAHDRYNNNIRRRAHDDFSDDTDYGKEHSNK
ncbi:unnamed protein product [Euphydryas editha]|uniref:Uncharacterized protein n=1 Tax=Euphydryas editha TaxID=104508 RepID=A0AAU9TDH9_EUPED|nr:unnamed protein product [Euphydryas editha]